MQAGSGVGLAITNAISEAVIHKTGSSLKGYQVGLWIGFAVTLLCVGITLVFVPSKATLEKKKLARAEKEAEAGDITLESSQVGDDGVKDGDGAPVEEK